MIPKVKFFLHFYYLCDREIHAGTDGKRTLSAHGKKFKISCSKDFWVGWSGDLVEYGEVPRDLL